MNYNKKYINFINGRNTGEGLRITAGILFPSLLMHYFNLLPVGIVMSVAALCVSVADTPGAVGHRLRGMFASCLLVTALSILVYYAKISSVLLGLLIILSGFFFSMLTVFGNRSSAVGIAVLLIMVLSMQSPLNGMQIWINAGYIFIGALWYMLYSLLLYRLRPYKFIQQVLADYIADVAVFLKLRGELYDFNPDYEKVNEQLLQQQIQIEAQQLMLSELLFNTRAIVKETTHTGRVLVKTYLEVAELYESGMTTYQDYSLLHEQFGKTGILYEFHKIINLLFVELEEISIAFKSNISSEPNPEPYYQVQKIRKSFELLRKDFMNDDNVENFVSLGKIVNTLEDIATKIKLLHEFTTYEVKLKKEEINPKAHNSFDTTQKMRPALFFDNLNFESNIFRHSLRVSLALLVGYIVSLFYEVDRGYWILLTIIVILKPAYALSKRRNSDRLFGTAVGAVIGLLVLFLIKNNTALLFIMIFFMGGSYMFLRTNYFMGVLLMTPYLLIFFQLLYPGNLNELMLERVKDTAIGSLIAFFASLFLVPTWERNTIKSYMLKTLEANDKYYQIVALNFSSLGTINKIQIRVARREVLIALANLSDAFTRMLSEPKRHRQGIKNIHRFVSMNLTLTSHLASLSYLLQRELNSFRSQLLLPVIENTHLYFSNAIHILKNGSEEIIKPNQSSLGEINEKVNELLEKRKIEIAQGQLETNTKKELVQMKSVTDQFNFIFSDAAAIFKITKAHDKEMSET